MSGPVTITILGCGASSGVPRIGGHWGACDPKNPKNKRRRCSMMVQRTGEHGSTNVLVDTSPDMREQLLDLGTGLLDGVLFTHEHADHTHGIDDLRGIAINGRSKVPVYFDATTGDFLMTKFSYCFETPRGSDYPPILDGRLISPGKRVTIEGEGGPLTAMPFTQTHGNIGSLGFRFGDVAYSADLSDVPDASLEYLEGLDIWIVDALRRRPHPSHFSLDEALAWINRIKPKRAILTNMHIDMDYETLCAELPDRVVPAYDGMVIEVSGV